MSFRDNLQHLRATRNMTQEQLAMLLGVSRQSVSKWEAERAYPEMDKLLKLCDLFGCTIDQLVCKDVTDRASDETARIPPALAPQDVTGYDQAMRAFAWKVPLGVAIVVAGIAIALFLSEPVLAPGIDVYTYGCAVAFAGFALGAALVLPAAFQRSGFRKAHPFVEDFYAAEQKDQARASLLSGLVAGIGLIMAGAVAAVLLQASVWLASAGFLLFAAAGMFFILRGCLLHARCDVEKYNRASLRRLDDAGIDALDEGLAVCARRAKREHGLYVAIMCASTAVGLVMLFTPASRWFFLAWPVGGLACAAIKAIISARSGE